MYWMQKIVPFAKEHISKNHKMYLLTKAFMKTNEQSSYSRYFENQLNLPKKATKGCYICGCTHIFGFATREISFAVVNLGTLFV